MGEALASHRDVNMVAFTGSCEVGKRIMELASKTVKRLQLELGGKNPVIVLDDADLDMAVSEGVTGQVFNCGQVCGSPGRFYVHEKIYDEFVEKFVAGMKKVVVGDPLMKRHRWVRLSAPNIAPVLKASLSQVSMKELSLSSAASDRPNRRWIKVTS